MRKKILIALLSLIAVFACATGIAACKVKSIENHTHTYGELIEEQSATCTQTGRKAYYYCAECGKYFDENKAEKTVEELTLAIDPNAHTYGNLISEQPATCAATGMKAHYHCACGKYFDENKAEKEISELTLQTDPSAHTYGNLISEQPATCAATGMKTHYHCACGKYFDEDKVEKTLDQLIIALLEHTYGDLIAEQPATCAATGMKAHYHCNVCGKYFDQSKVEKELDQLTIGLAEHTYGEVIEEQPATCTETGMKRHYYCSVCGKYFDESKVEKELSELTLQINPAAHNYGEIIGERLATCEHTGMQRHFYCADCDTYFDENKVEKSVEDLTIGLAEHKYGDLIVEKPSTCAATGLKEHFHCYVCDKYFDKNKVEKTLDELEIEINPAAHDYGNWVMELPATCGSKGMKAHYKCACGKYFDNQFIETTAEILSIPAKEGSHELVSGKDVCTICGTHLTAGLKYTLLDNGTYSVSKGSATDLDIIIPAKFDGIGVTKIPNGGFKESRITSIIVPDSVITIDTNAFFRCKSLKTVKFGSGFCDMGYTVFYECDALESATFANPTGWWAQKYAGTNETKYYLPELTDPAQNAQFLKNTYMRYWWRRA